MTTESVEPQIGRARFTGSRWELAATILRGYLLMIPTIGLYRFWQATWKRRFYWHNTIIEGDPLEYTGTPSQLLIGFLFALAFFLPIYVAFFYLSTQLADVALWGYGAVFALLWFLSGYAAYRGRDFRLSRTLWRGVRFNQHGNAWAYALRRFLWSLLMVPTLGLIYPFMAASLWRYRYRHTWFGDRAFSVTASWRQLAGPFYGAWFINLLFIASITGYIVSTRDLVIVDKLVLPGPLSALLILGEVLVFAASIALFRARSASRFLSGITIGDAALKVEIRARDLFVQSLVYVVALLGLLLVFAVIALVALGSILAVASAGGEVSDPAKIMAFFQSGTINVVIVIAAYLVLLGAFGLLAEIILSFGWWKLLARGATITNAASLETVRATAEDRALIGEGLADALNVGAY